MHILSTMIAHFQLLLIDYMQCVALCQLMQFLVSDTPRLQVAGFTMWHCPISMQIYITVHMHLIQVYLCVYNSLVGKQQPKEFSLHILALTSPVKNSVSSFSLLVEIYRTTYSIIWTTMDT